MGILAHEFVIGKPPFETKHDATTKQKIRTLDFEFPEEARPDFKDFVSHCLKKESSERASLEQLESHPWIRKNVNWTEMRQLLAD